MPKTAKQVVSGGYHRPVCPECQCEMRPKKNGVGVLDHADFGPYALYDADLWACPRCGKQVIGGFATGPISRHHDPDFTKMLAHYEESQKLYKNFDYVEGTDAN